MAFAPLFILFLIIAVLLGKSMHVLPADKRGVLFRLGRMYKVVGPGLVITTPFIDRMIPVSVAEQSINAPFALGAKTLEAVCRFRIADPKQALLSVADYREALAKTVSRVTDDFFSMRSVTSVSFVSGADSSDIRTAVQNAVKDWGLEILAISFERPRS